MREVNLDGIDEKYQGVKAFIKTLGQINEEFNSEQGITEDYLGPFNKGYELQSLIAEVRKNLIWFLAEKLNRQLCPNVTVSPTEIEKKLTEKFGELGFNADFIYRYVQTNFVTRSATLSREEILEKARYLLPTLWGEYGRRKLTPEDILKGRKLILTAYMDSYYPNSHDGLIAVEKLVKIVLDNEDPATVTADGIASIYWQLRGDELYRTRELRDSNIEKVRAYKNNKFLIYFKDEEKAQKVAKTLLRREWKEKKR